MNSKDGVTILFSSAGRRVALMNIFRKAAKEISIGAEIVAVDMDPSWSPACHAADRAYKVVRCTSTDFIPQMLDICRNHNIKLIVPTIDTELMVFAENKSLFTEIGTDIHIADSHFVAIARDKEATVRMLGRHNIPVPDSWNVSDLLNKLDSIVFPLLIKPKGGSSSKEISVIASIEELHKKINGQNEWLIQEVCEGQEYTINCFYNRSGTCVTCVPHIRKFVRDGEVCFAETERVPKFTAIAHKLSGIFKGIRGAICFQGFKQADGSVQIFEINARFGGGYPVCDRAGGTFAKWILQELIGSEPDYHDSWREGVRMLRYDEAFFLEV